MKITLSNKNICKVSHSLYEHVYNIFIWNKSLTNFIINYSWAQWSASTWSNCRWSLCSVWSAFKFCLLSYILWQWGVDCGRTTIMRHNSIRYRSTLRVLTFSDNECDRRNHGFVVTNLFPTQSLDSVPFLESFL